MKVAVENRLPITGSLTKDEIRNADRRAGQLSAFIFRFLALGVLAFASTCLLHPASACAQKMFTGNAFVTAAVEDATGKIEFYAGSATGSHILAYNSSNSRSYLSVMISGQCYSNNTDFIPAGKPDHQLDNGINSQIGDTIETVWKESGFDIVQDVYPVAFAISGQIVYKIKVVNHSALSLNVQAQYLLDIDVAGNDAAKVLTSWNYTPNWKQYPDSLGRMPWFFMGFKVEPTLPQNGALIGTGYLNDTLAPLPMGLMQPILFDVVDWVTQTNYAWGLQLSPPWGTAYGDNAVLLQWRANVANGNLGKDSVQEIARGSYGTGEFNLCTGSLVGITFYPHRLTYDSKNHKYLHNPFQVLSMIFNPSTLLPVDTTFATLTVTGPLRILSPKPVTSGGLTQRQGLGDEAEVDSGGSIAPLDVAQALWIDSTLDVTNCSQDSIASISINVRAKGISSPFVPACDMSVIVECTNSDLIPPRSTAVSGSELDSVFSIADNSSQDKGLRSVSWTFSPASAKKFYHLVVNAVDSVSPANYSCIKTATVPLHITQKDSTISACIDFTFTDCNNNSSYREVCFNSHISPTIKDVTPPQFSLLNRVHWPNGNDSSSLTKRGCNSSQHSYWLVADTQLYDRGIGSIDSVQGQSSNMQLLVKPFVKPAQRAFFEVIVRDSMVDGKMIVKATDTAGNTAYDTITYCTVPDIVPPTAVAVPLINGTGYHVRASDTQAWDRKIQCAYLTGMVNIQVILPPGYDSSRSKDTLIICSNSCDSVIGFDVLKRDSLLGIAFFVQGRDCAGNYSYPPYLVGSSAKTDALCPNISWSPPLAKNTTAVNVTVNDYHYSTQGQEIAYDEGIDSVWFTFVHNIDLVLPAQTGDRGPGVYSPPVSIHFTKDITKHPEFPKSVTFGLRVRDTTTIDPLPACITVNARDGGGNLFCAGDTQQWCYTISHDLNPPQAVATDCTDTSIALTVRDTNGILLNGALALNELGLKRFWIDPLTNRNFVPFDRTYPGTQAGLPSDGITLRVSTPGKSATGTIHAIDLIGSAGIPGHETIFPVWMYVQDLAMRPSTLLTDTGSFVVPVYLVANDSTPVSQKQLSQYTFTFHLSGSNAVSFVQAETIGTLTTNCTVTPAGGRTYWVTGVPVGGTLPDRTPAQMTAVPLLNLRFKASAFLNAELCSIVMDGTGPKVRYNNGQDSSQVGANYIVTACPPYGNVSGSVVILKGPCTPMFGSNMKPNSIALAPASPNPASKSTTVIYSIPDSSSFVKLELFNDLGDRVQTFVAEIETQGEYKVELPTAQISPGNYFLRLEAGGKVVSRKISIVR